MRSAPELIAELEEESRKHFTCQLVVAFENTAILLAASDPRALQTLNLAIGTGGIPIGLIATDKKTILNVSTRVYPEHMGEAADLAEECLGEIARNLRTAIGEESVQQKRRGRSWGGPA